MSAVLLTLAYTERKVHGVDLKKLLDNGRLILDGAFGTELQKRGLKTGQIPELISFTDPDTVSEIHRSYVEAGSDIIMTNTFGANRYKLSGSGLTVEEAVARAVSLAKGVGAKYVALDVGPLGRLLEPTGDLSFEEAYDAFREVILEGYKCGVDLVMIETMTDLYEMKAALLAVKDNTDLPVICSMSFEKNGRTFTGCGVKEAAIVLSSLGADVIGVNCSTGPDDLYEVVRTMTAYSSVPVSVKPNAGLPDPVTGEYSIDEKAFASLMARYADLGVKLYGGCCGTSPAYIKAMKTAVSEKDVKDIQRDDSLILSSFTKCVDCSDPVIIGERINPTGKKLLKEALASGNMDYILSLAAEQASAGADVLDINVGLPGIDEKALMVRVIKTVQSVTDLLIQIDSSDPEVIEASLRVCRGKPIVNSVNGRLESLKSILPIVKKYGAALVGLTLDENGIPDPPEERFRIAERIVNAAVDCGIPKSDIVIDPLTLTVSTDNCSALKTLGALRMIKDRLGVKTVLGVSNVSFGLPERERVGAAFLDMALKEGLDFAIINPSLLSVTAPPEAYKVLNASDPGATEYIASCRAPDKKNITSPREMPAHSLPVAIELGFKDESRRLTNDLLEKMPPQDVINKELIPILDSVGDRFDKGELFLPQLIMAADTVGVCFDAVKEKMAMSEVSGTAQGKIILATVKGDIHDIGKSIVKVLLENYGYEIIDLGRDVPPETVLSSAVENNVKLVGLSALMTTTLGSMKDTVELVKSNIPDCRVMVGGAVLTEEYAHFIGADFYAKDAKGAVDIAKRVFPEQ